MESLEAARVDFTSLSEQVARLVQRWSNTITGRAVEPKIFPFSLYFLAGTLAAQTKVLDILRQQLEKAGFPQETFRARISQPNPQAVVREIDSIKEKIGRGKDPVAIVLLDGFGDIVNREDNVFGTSLGHLLYQRLEENTRLKRYLGRKNRHVVVVTTITEEVDKLRYAQALTSAQICQFKDGMLVF